MTVRLTFTGAMVDKPTAGKTAGTDFTLSVYKNEQGSAAALTKEDAGNALVQFSFDPVGGILVTNNSASARIEQITSATLRPFNPFTDSGRRSTSSYQLSTMAYRSSRTVEVRSWKWRGRA